MTRLLDCGHVVPAAVLRQRCPRCVRQRRAWTIAAFLAAPLAYATAGGQPRPAPTPAPDPCKAKLVHEGREGVWLCPEKLAEILHELEALRRLRDLRAELDAVRQRQIGLHVQQTRLADEQGARWKALADDESKRADAADARAERERARADAWWRQPAVWLGTGAAVALGLVVVGR